MQNEVLINLTADIVAAQVANNSVALSDVPLLIQQVHDALARLSQPQAAPEQPKTPFVSVKASVKPDHLVCLECGRKSRTLKRHLMTAHKMSPDVYRADYGLPRDYPMVAPEYSTQRADLARSSGLGRRK